MGGDPWCHRGCDLWCDRGWGPMRGVTGGVTCEPGELATRPPGWRRPTGFASGGGQFALAGGALHFRPLSSGGGRAHRSWATGRRALRAHSRPSRLCTTPPTTGALLVLKNSSCCLPPCRGGP